MLVASRIVDPFAPDGEFSIGVMTLDAEHRNLFEQIKKLQTALENGAGAEMQSALLHQLAAATAAHFASEESMMAENHYAGITLHKMKHEDLLQKLGAFVVRFDHGAALNQHSLQFLRDWLTVHIREVDKFFGLWLNEHT
jgi:hemerythrin